MTTRKRFTKKDSNRILFLPNSFEHEQENPCEQFYKIARLIILFCLVDKMQYNVSDILLKSMLFSYPKWVSTGDDWDESVWMAFSIICTVRCFVVPYIQRHVRRTLYTVYRVCCICWASEMKWTRTNFLRTHINCNIENTTTYMYAPQRHTETETFSHNSNTIFLSAALRAVQSEWIGGYFKSIHVHSAGFYSTDIRKMLQTNSFSQILFWMPLHMT